MPKISEKMRAHLRARALASLKQISDEEDAEITRAANSDPDCPILTDEQLRRMRPMAEVRPDLVDAFRRARGRPKLERTKVQVTLRLDADVIETFKSEGQGWQSRINDVLARAVKRRKSIA